jgi:hypothetical protein
MLVTLRNWWQKGRNSVRRSRPNTISPIPEGIPLLEAESIARQEEQGDGLPQKDLMRQIDEALSSTLHIFR